MRILISNIYFFSLLATLASCGSTDYLTQSSYFLETSDELRSWGRLEAGDYLITVSGKSDCPIDETPAVVFQALSVGPQQQEENSAQSISLSACSTNSEGLAVKVNGYASFIIPTYLYLATELNIIGIQKVLQTDDVSFDNATEVLLTKGRYLIKVSNKMGELNKRVYFGSKSYPEESKIELNFQKSDLENTNYLGKFGFGYFELNEPVSLYTKKNGFSFSNILKITATHELPYRR